MDFSCGNVKLRREQRREQRFAKLLRFHISKVEIFKE